MNFLEETKDAIKESNHRIEDIMFIGSSDDKYRINWNDFINISDFDYDNGYGCIEIASNLIVYFKDGTYLFRNDYDGSEWWQCVVKKPFNENDEYYSFNKIKDIYKICQETIPLNNIQDKIQKKIEEQRQKYYDIHNGKCSINEIPFESTKVEGAIEVLEELLEENIKEENS